MAGKGLTTADGQTLVRMLVSASERLRAGAASLDALNVFPVPDGDTGTNMLHTVRAALEAAAALVSDRASGRDVPMPGAAAVAAAMAKGAMEGARGNSGIILSQFFRGLAEALEGKDVCSSPDLAQAFRRAESFARGGISDPAEGTILTVLGDVARALADRRERGAPSLAATLDAAVEAAAASVERTPTLLAVLRDAGVVDAGAEGLRLVLEGFRGALGDGRSPRPAVPVTAPRSVSEPAHRTPRTRSYGFCTEFLLSDATLPLERIRERLALDATSVIVVGDRKTARIHVHTAHPAEVVAFARGIGTVADLQVQDLDRQSDAAALAAAVPEEGRDGTTIVALVEGEGFAAIFAGLGAVPYAGDPARALEGVSTREVIVLANSASALDAAGSFRAPEGVTVRVVPSRTVPEGIAALLAYRFDRDAAANVAAMRSAATAITTLEVPAGTPDPVGTLERLLDAAGRGRVDVVTVYQGSGADDALAERAAAACRAAFPEAEVEIAVGGQRGTILTVSLE